MLFFLFFLALGVKTVINTKLRGPFCSFVFLRGQNHNFVKVRGLKLQLSLILNNGRQIDMITYVYFLFNV